MAAVGDGARDANERRNVAKVKGRKRQQALMRAEQRELEASRERQEQLRREFYTRNPDLAA